MGPMAFDFERIIDRQRTGAAKWQSKIPGEGGPPLLAMSVADMEIAAPDPVREAMIERIDHGIFGYTMVGAEFREAAAAWQMERHSSSIEPEWVVTHHGVLPSLFQLIRTFLPEGSAVVLQTPAFPPFLDAIGLHGHHAVANDLVRRQDTYSIDFEDFEKACRDPATRLFILCNPHNPTGRSFTPGELRRLAEISARHGVMVFADEIHGDLVLPPGCLAPFLSVCGDLDIEVVTANGLSKTMNLAGLALSNLVIPSATMRESYEKAMLESGEWGVNPVSAAAFLAGYRHGGPWLDALLDHVAGNMAFVDAYCARHLPEVLPTRTEGTYLKWLDMTRVGFDEEDLMDRLVNRQRLLVQAGSAFGASGKGFLRLNLACPRSSVAEAMARIARVVRSND